MLALRRCRSLFNNLRTVSVASGSIVTPANYGQERTNSASANTNFFIREVQKTFKYLFGFIGVMCTEYNRIDTLL